MPGHPEVEVRLGPVGELLEDPALADRLDHREIHVVIPALRGLGQRDVMASFQAQVVAVHSDVLEELFVATRLGQVDVGLGTGLVQAGLFLESGILRLADQVVDVQIGGQRHPGRNLGHPGLDLLQAIGSGHRDPVVPVANEIDLAHQVDVDGGEAAGAMHGHVDPLPAFFGGRVEGEEGPVEVPVAPHAADDVGDGDHPGSPRHPCGGAEQRLDLVEGEQGGVRPAAEKAQQRADHAAGLQLLVLVGCGSGIVSLRVAHGSES